jgi:hypothetical protein
VSGLVREVWRRSEVGVVQGKHLEGTVQALKACADGVEVRALAPNCPPSLVRTSGKGASRLQTVWKSCANGVEVR